MKILFDQGTPVPLRHELVGHDVDTAFECGWAALSNGELLAKAETEGFQLLITTDQNLPYQLNLTNREIAILVLMSTSWPRLRNRIDVIRESVEQIQPGEYREVFI